MNDSETLIYIVDLSDNQANKDISHQMIKDKLLKLGYRGNIHISNNLSGNDSLKDAADVVIYWVASNYDDEDKLCTDIMHNINKAIIGCWPYSKNYMMLNLLTSDDIALTLDDIVARAVKRLNNLENSKTNKFN